MKRDICQALDKTSGSYTSSPSDLSAFDLTFVKYIARLTTLLRKRSAECVRVVRYQWWCMTMV